MFQQSNPPETPTPTKKKRFAFLRYKWARGVLAIFIIVLIIVAIIFGIGSPLSRDSKTTKLGFEDIGELATQAAYCTEVSKLNPQRTLWGINIPFTQSTYIYSYDIIIKAGLNFSDIMWSLDDENHVITVNLPEIKILSSEIDPDSFKIYLEEESIFRQISLAENNEQLKTLKEEAEKNAVENGLYDQALENAKTILTAFFSSTYNPEEVKIVFNSP